MNKRVSINLIGQICSFICSTGISFVLTPYIVAMLGEETYGFVGLANNFTSYISLITVAMSGMLSRYITLEYTQKNHKEASGYFSTAIISQGVLALILLVPMMLLSNNIAAVVNISPEIVPDVKILWILMFISFLAGLPTSAFNVAPFAKNRLEMRAIINIATQILRALVLVFAFMFYPPHVWYMGLATIASSSVDIVCNYICSRRLMPEMKFSFKSFKFRYIGKLVIVGIWSSLNKLQQLLCTGLDLLLTNLFINGSEMGLLSIAKSLPGNISSLISTISNAFDPGMTIAYANEDKTEFLKQTKYAMLLSGFICSVPIMGLVAFGMQFYSLWMPSLSDMEIVKVQILAVLTLFPQIFSVYVYPLYTVNTITLKLKIPVLVSLGIGLLNVAIVFLLLKSTSLGVYAVAGVSSILWVLRIFIFVPIYAACNLGLHLKTFYPPLIKGVINVIILALIMLLISSVFKAPSWLELILICLPTGLIGYIVSFLVLFNKQDKQKLFNMIKQKFNRR